MHRITVVSLSPERKCGRSSAASPDVMIQNWTPSSLVPPLEESFDDSSAREQRSPPTSVQQPRKKSTWRSKRIDFAVETDAAALDLDLSAMERRDLPIELVVDDPMPVGKYYGDPYADEKKKQRKSFKERLQTREIASSPVCVGDAKVGGAGSFFVDFGDLPKESTESWLVPFHRESETISEMETKERTRNDQCSVHAIESQSVECHLNGGSVSVEDRSCQQDVIRCNGPVIRIEYEGEMVSVIEQTAARLQEGECDWV